MKKLFTFLFAAIYITSINAQYLEMGATGGLTSYIGELQPNNPNNESYGLTYGAFGRYVFSPRFAAKATATMGSFYANDRYAKTSRRYRNLEVNTDIYELALTGEFYLNKFDYNDDKRLSAYVFAGASGFYFNPKARTFGGSTPVWHNLQPLNTEGVSYSQIQLAIPMGLGFKWGLTQRINLGFEAGLRFTFTDYLDDVSGFYPNLSELAEQNPLAYQLSFRTRELFPTAELPSGDKRGDSYKRDLFYQMGVTMSINLASKSKMEFNETYRSFNEMSMSNQ